MKVADVMSRQVDYVTPNTSVKEVCQLIFGRGINGVPVREGKKIVGFITERDVLSKFYPSIQEYIEDPVNMADFEKMEEKASEIFHLPAKKIMSRHPVTVTPNTPLLRAQSMMFVHKVGRLPVVDEDENLIGILSKSDIFRSVVGDRLPFISDEEYHDWLSKHYDLVVTWEERLGFEVKDLNQLFKKEKVRNVLDIGSGTGEHDIALAQKGFHVVGIEGSSLMFKAAQEKLNNLPKGLTRNLGFVYGDYVDLLKNYKDFQAAIFMGNMLTHLEDWEKVFRAVSASLRSKGAVVVFQIINFEKVFKVKKRFLDSNFAKSKTGIVLEHAFLEFYNPSAKKGGPLTLTMVILDFDGKRWKPRSINSTAIVNVGVKEIGSLLKKHGFKKISIYGSVFWGPLFENKFDPLQSDWLNIVARR